MRPPAFVTIATVLAPAWAWAWHANPATQLPARLLQGARARTSYVASAESLRTAGAAVRQAADIGGSLAVGVWMPMASVAALEGLSPVRVELASHNYVVWEHAGRWSVLADVCPHRLAPLSEGRVDGRTGCIECPYHGWQFAQDGACTRVPQSDKGPEVGVGTPGYETCVFGDVIWARLPGEKLGLRPGACERSPEEVWPDVASMDRCLVRDLPYSVDFLVENFMDLAHIPFAHHGLQSLRSDGCPIPVGKERFDEDGLRTTFQDLVRGKPRKGAVSFDAPCYYRLAVDVKEGEPRKTFLRILCVPVRPGRCRIFANVVGIPRRGPVWLSHAFMNSFFDTDAWLHDVENHARGTRTTEPLPVGWQFGGRGRSLAPHADGEITTESEGRTASSTQPQLQLQYEEPTQPQLQLQYAEPTASDQGARFFRQWWRQSGLADSPAFGPQHARDLAWQSRADVYDRWTAHTHQCAACQRALRLARKARNLAPLVAMVPVALGLPMLMRMAGVVGFLVVQRAAERVERDTMGAPTPAEVPKHLISHED